MPTFAIHRDSRYYENPDKFDPWRFLSSSEGHQKPSSYVTTSKEFLGWGLGRSACPGRFLADMEIKLVLTHLLLDYDIKNPDGAGRPPDIFIQNLVRPLPCHMT